MRSQSIDAVGNNGLTLRIEFIHRNDRFAHVLSVVDRDRRKHPIFESVEGTPADDWPPSPPLQNLSIEQLAPGRRAALLVGMAGRSHWSASIEPVPGLAALVLDIACRTNDRGVSLGSRYRVLRPETPQLAVTAELACAVRTVGEDSIAIVPDETGGAGTIRWKYRISLLRA
jgi:hypothetical protein